MKVSELIELLQKIDDPSRPVELAVGFHKTTVGDDIHISLMSGNFWHSSEKTILIWSGPYLPYQSKVKELDRLPF